MCDINVKDENNDDFVMLPHKVMSNDPFKCELSCELNGETKLFKYEEICAISIVKQSNPASQEAKKSNTKVEKVNLLKT
jgi:hypothetical protein